MNVGIENVGEYVGLALVEPVVGENVGSEYDGLADGFENEGD